MNDIKLEGTNNTRYLSSKIIILWKGSNGGNINIASYDYWRQR